VFYRAGGKWKPVEISGSYGAAPNTYNTAKFKPIESDALRIEVRLQAGFSGGILEWKIE
jgi:uncharacterized protein